ncbi:hypothetical protein HY041_02995 [Candidatus Roizmanbacteria bacterium]|nr:hypothetical protein [Candidatus Roizmanbacteria bacterium]
MKLVNKIIFFTLFGLLIFFAGIYLFFGKQYLGKKTKAQLVKTYAWEFNQEGQLESWNGVGFSEGAVVTSGNLKAVIKNIKQPTVFPTFFSPFINLDAKNFNRLEVRMKILSESILPTPTSTPSANNIITGLKTSSGKPFTLTVSFLNQKAKIDDWISLANAQVNTSIIDDRAYLDWKWLNNSQTSPSKIISSGIVTFENVQPGNYVVLYYTRKNTSPWPWEKISSGSITIRDALELGKPISIIAPIPPIANPPKGSMLLMFGPSNSDYSGAKSMKLETIENNEFNTYVFDLSKNTDWQGLINQIKLVPTFNTPRTVLIDWIRFSSIEIVPPPPIKTDLYVTEFGTIVEQSLISSVTNLSAGGTKPIAPPPTKIPPKKTYLLKTGDGRVYSLTQTVPVAPEIFFGQFSGKTVFVEGTMKQNLLFKCQSDKNCFPPSIIWWPLPNGLVFEVRRIQLAQKGYDTTVLGIPSGYIQNATITYTGENVFVLKMQQVQIGVAENENKRNMPVQKELYIRSSYDDLAPLIGTMVSLKGNMYTVGTTQIMNLSIKGITIPPKEPPLKGGVGIKIK